MTFTFQLWALRYIDMRHGIQCLEEESPEGLGQKPFPVGSRGPGASSRTGWLPSIESIDGISSQEGQFGVHSLVDELMSYCPK